MTPDAIDLDALAKRKAANARERAQDESLALAIDHIASVILALGGTVSEVIGYDCAEPR